MLNHPPPLNNHILVQSPPHFTKVPSRMRWEDSLPLLQLASSLPSPLGHYLWEKPDTVSQGHSRQPWGQAQVARSWVRPLLNSCGEWKPAHTSRWSDCSDERHERHHRHDTLAGQVTLLLTSEPVWANMSGWKMLSLGVTPVFLSETGLSQQPIQVAWRTARHTGQTTECVLHSVGTESLQGWAFPVTWFLY